MSAVGMVKSVFVEGIMNIGGDSRIFSKLIDASVIKFEISADFVFQQDNDPKHKSKFTVK